MAFSTLCLATRMQFLPLPLQKGGNGYQQMQRGFWSCDKEKQTTAESAISPEAFGKLQNPGFPNHAGQILVEMKPNAAPLCVPLTAVPGRVACKVQLCWYFFFFFCWRAVLL